jgi:hypothetical protein
MKFVSVLPWIAVGALVVSAGSYMSFLFTGSTLGALMGIGGLGLAILLMVGWFGAKVGKG